MARSENAERGIGRGKSQATSSTGAGSSATTRGSRGGAEQEQRMPVSREGSQRGTAMSRPPQSSLLPSSIFAAPPGQLSGAFMSNPFGFMRRMSEEMNRIFESAGLGGAIAPVGGMEQASMATWMPQIEVRQKGNEFVVRADLPGLKREDVSVEVDDGILTLSGERRQESSEEHEGFYRSERSYGSFYRAIPIPEGVNEEEISATFGDGVLEVHVPVPAGQQRRGRKVEIK
jgi:HSP20 family protein